MLSGTAGLIFWSIVAIGMMVALFISVTDKGGDA